MSDLGRALLESLDDGDLALLAERLQSHLGAAEPAANGRWLNTTEAAEYIAAPVSRVHDLTALGKLSPRRDGRRLLFRAEDLDAYLERQ